MSELNLSNMRADYSKDQLDETMVDENPFTQFKAWFNDAIGAKIAEPNIMVLSTVSQEQKPSSRVVLLKDIKPDGFTFYTNYLSKKANEIEHNNHVSLVFLWIELQRQVRIEGTVSKLSEEESSAYFKTRPIESQIGAHISNQSSIIENRAVLESKFEDFVKNHKLGTQIEKPKFWGGYHVKPTLFEFWQGRTSRLHDRIVYTTKGPNVWTINRLAP